MRSRILHLLALMVIVAALGAALQLHSEILAGAIAFTSWMIYAAFGWAALAYPKHRFILGSALLFGVSFLCLQLVYWGRRTLPIILSERILTSVSGPDLSGYRASILEFAWSFVFALIGAMLARSFAERRERHRSIADDA
jgi:hypothetical protein